MKKVFISLLCLLCVGFCSCEEIEQPKETTAATVTEQPSTKTSETTDLSLLATDTENGNKDLYADEINFIIEPYQNQPDKLKGQYYVLYDIDGNGIEELLWGMDVYGGISLNSIFSIQNGVAVEWDEFFSAYRNREHARQTLLFCNGVIRSDSDHEGVPIFNYYRFEAGIAKPLAEIFTVNGDYYSRDPVTKNERSITKEEYDRVKKEMEGDGQVVELDWRPLAEYGQ